MRKIGVLIEAPNDEFLLQVLHTTTTLRDIVLSKAEIDLVNPEDELCAIIIIKVGDEELLKVRLTQ